MILLVYAVFLYYNNSVLDVKKLKLIEEEMIMTGFYDIHCHILPGVDDGSQDMEETKKMLQIEYDSGIRHIIATPHYRKNMFEPLMDLVEQQYLQVQGMAKTIGDGIQVHLGCEFHVNMSIIETLQKNDRPTMAGSRYVLAEFSGASEVPFIKERIYCLISSGYIPILAHIERYPCIVKDMNLVSELVDMGAYMQVNAESVIGDDGRLAKKFCKNLIKEDLLHFIGTDAHGYKARSPKMGKCAAYLQKKFGKEYVHRILIENPRRIIEQ